MMEGAGGSREHRAGAGVASWWRKELSGMISLAGQVGLITGASRGIGRGTALYLARHGMAVAVNYARSEKDAQEVVERIRAEGGTAIAVRADVAVRREVEAMVEQVEDALGGIDFLMNNAGVAIDVPLAEMTDEAWDRVVDVNLRGVFLCAQIVSRGMLERGRGKIVNVSAATALRGRKNGANYCAAKAGVLALTKCLALELAPNIQVNALLPGFTLTDDVIKRFNLDDPKERLRVLEGIPLGRFADVEDIARGVLFLASHLSDHMTGQMLCINGGSFMG